MNVSILALKGTKQYGEYTKLHFGGRSYTNVKLQQSAGRLARTLQEHGVQPGDRVIVLMPNCPEVLDAFQAVWQIGGAIVPVTPHARPEEIAYLIDDSGARVMLTSSSLVEHLAEVFGELTAFLRVLVFRPSTIPGAADITAEYASAIPTAAHCPRLANDLAALVYTSGTTGHPKGVMLTHENILSGVEALRRVNPNLPRSIILHVLPLSHVFGVIAMCLAEVWGFTTVLLEQFDPENVFQAIQNYRIEHFPVVPTMLAYLIRSPVRTMYDTSSLRFLTSGGAMLPEALRLEFQRLFPGCQVRQGYGLSESAGIATGYAVEEPYQLGSVGRAVRSAEIKIVDDADTPQPSQQLGEICLAGANITPGYWRHPEKSQSVLRNGWLHTGDIGWLDESGYLYVVERKKDLIIKGGENIVPREVEEAIQNHPSVAAVAVIGIPDPVFGENICAVIVPRLGMQPTEEDIRNYVGEHIAKFKIPACIVFRDDLPKSPVGKVLKRELRKQLAGHVPDLG